MKKSTAHLQNLALLRVKGLPVNLLEISPDALPIKQLRLYSANVLTGGGEVAKNNIKGRREDGTGGVVGRAVHVRGGELHVLSKGLVERAKRVVLEISPKVETRLKTLSPRWQR